MHKPEKNNLEINVLLADYLILKPGLLNMQIKINYEGNTESLILFGIWPARVFKAVDLSQNRFQ